MTISKRLETIVNMLEPCRVLADIGCDHGYVSIRAVQNKLAKQVIAADVAKGPLEAAKRNAAAEGTAGKTSFILSDGLKAIPDEAGVETIVIAGMGGILIRDILKAGELNRFPELKQLILGPQSDLDLVRRYLIDETPLYINSEKCIYDDGKYYFLMDVRKKCSGSKRQKITADTYSAAEYAFGKYIAPETAKTYKEFLEFRLRIAEGARAAASKGSGERTQAKLRELEGEIALINKALGAAKLHT
ncbi:MAG: class I SAM-dependent methyltransferase [Eubacteriales bacterium]|nr:class I SAM-dependent methyltransferase [Eubacteriales bacterium]